MDKIIAITGQTASGKSEMSVSLAILFSGEIVCADSRQIYKDISIGAAQINEKEMNGIPHYALDIASPKEVFSVAQYQKIALEKIADIINRARVPFVVGGSGMYIDAITNNPQYPKIGPNQKERRELENKSADELFLELKNLNPKRAQTIDKKNKRRLIRALEIQKAKGAIPRLKNNPIYNCLKLSIKIEKEELNKRIETRFYKALKQGHIEEVKAAREKYNLSWKRIDELGLSYKWIGRFLQGNITREEMKQKSVASIRQYAKRQATWFNKDVNIVWIKTETEAEEKIKEFLR